MELTTEQFDELKNLGFTKYKNFFNEEEVTFAKKIIKFRASLKAEKESFFVVNLAGFLIRLIRCDFAKIKQSLSLINLSKKKKLREISNKFFGKKSFLNMVDGYCSPISNEEVLPWHCDQSYSNQEKINKFKHPDDRQFKFFIYLTPVQSDNGCMCYIPQSHKIAYALKMGILEKKIHYQKFQYLKDFRKIISINSNYSYIKNFLKNQEILDRFLENTKFAENNLDTNLYDYDMEAGDAIIFDENGFHKGSKISKNERVVLRFFYNTTSPKLGFVKTT